MEVFKEFVKRLKSGQLEYMKFRFNIDLNIIGVCILLKMYLILMALALILVKNLDISQLETFFMIWEIVAKIAMIEAVMIFFTILYPYLYNVFVWITKKKFSKEVQS